MKMDPDEGASRAGSSFGPGRAGNVILVDRNDREIGQMEKLAAHREGRLHRAFSIFLFNDEGSFLLQQRSLDKYHSAGLWSNTACSHPRPGESTHEAAARRLPEEMGLDCALDEVCQLIYRADLGGLVEFEFDHILTGTSNEDPDPDPDEVQGWRWVSYGDLTQEMSADPERFTYWFRLVWNTAYRLHRR